MTRRPETGNLVVIHELISIKFICQ